MSRFVTRGQSSGVEEVKIVGADLKPHRNHGQVVAKDSTSPEQSDRLEDCKGFGPTNIVVDSRGHARGDAAEGSQFRFGRYYRLRASPVEPPEGRQAHLRILAEDPRRRSGFRGPGYRYTG